MFRPAHSFAAGALLATLALLLSAAPAAAGIVSPLPIVTVSSNRINLVGYSSTASDPLNAADSVEYASKLRVTVHDHLDVPVAGIAVGLDFSLCASDVRIALVQSFHQELTNCPYAFVQGITDSHGAVSFVVIGGRSGDAAHALRCCKMYIDSFLWTSLNVGTFDQDNTGGVNGNDLSLFALDLYGHLNPDRSDFNGDGVVNGADLSIFGSALLGGRSTASGATFCP